MKKYKLIIFLSLSLLLIDGCSMISKFLPGKNIKISSKNKITSLITHLEKLLDKKGFFVPHEKKHSMMMNINNLFYRLEPNDKEVRILASIISSLSKKNINRN